MNLHCYIAAGQSCLHPCTDDVWRCKGQAAPDTCCNPSCFACSAQHVCRGAVYHAKLPSAMVMRCSMLSQNYQQQVAVRAAWRCARHGSPIIIQGQAPGYFLAGILRCCDKARCETEPRGAFQTACWRGLAQRSFRALAALHTPQRFAPGGTASLAAGVLVLQPWLQQLGRSWRGRGARPYAMPVQNFGDANHQARTSCSQTPFQKELVQLRFCGVCGQRYSCGGWGGMAWHRMHCVRQLPQGAALCSSGTLV